MNRITWIERLRPLTLALALGGPLVYPALADAAEVEEAEHERVSDEMERLAARNAWSGVERSFQTLLDLSKKGVVLTVADYYLGAQASRGVGDMAECERRLRTGAKVEGTPEIISWLEEIATNYGPVKLSAEKGVVPTLEPAAMPFAPDQRKAIEVAAAAMTQDRKFEGLLPKGAYSLGAQEFKVEPGAAELKVHLGANSASTSGDPDAPFAFNYVGLRAEAGPSFTIAGAPSETNQPPSFSGLGGRLDVGVEVGVGRRFGALVAVGYHNLIAPNAEIDHGDNIHLGYGLLGGAARFGDLWFSGGGLIGAGVSKAVGVGDLDRVNADCPYGSEAPDCAWVSSVPEDARAGYPWTGTIRPAGFQLSGAYTFMDIGAAFRGGVALTGGVLFDPYRSYPWGQLAFVLGPVASRGE